METAEYAPVLQRARIQGDAVCYARAVRVQEWPAMADGNGSPAPSVWSTDFRTAFTVITALLTTTLCIIRDVDRPFGGIIDVQPTAIAEAERQAERDFKANHPTDDLPCDASGNRLAA